MRYAIICHDKPDALQVRSDNRVAHLAYIQSTGVVEQAGPFLNAAGQMCGSLLILAVASLDDARAWAAGDPYGQVGLFATTTVIEWKKVIG